MVDQMNDVIEEEKEQIPRSLGLCTKFYGTIKQKLCVILITNFLDHKYANELFERLRNIRYNTDEDSMVRIRGFMIKVPRKQVAYGDPEANYHFSGTSVRARDWYSDGNDLNARVGRELMALAKNVSGMTGREFNYVLVNNYENQNNSIGYHSDDERELGKAPMIAGVTLGQERLMCFKSNLTGEVAKISVPHNSLYLMIYPTNRYWQHSIPKSSKPLGQRISLTYRQIRQIFTK